jgi:hypothetical protein
VQCDCLSSCVTWSDGSKQLLRWRLLVLLDQMRDGSMTRWRREICRRVRGDDARWLRVRVAVSELGRRPATTQAEAALELLPVAVREAIPLP